MPTRWPPSFRRPRGGFPRASTRPSCRHSTRPPSRSSSSASPARGRASGDVSTYVTNELTPLLERVPGVANVQVDGGPSRQFQVLLNPDRLQSFNLTPQQVVGGHRRVRNQPAHRNDQQPQQRPHLRHGERSRGHAEGREHPDRSGPGHPRERHRRGPGFPRLDELRAGERQAGRPGLHPEDHLLQCRRRGQEREELFCTTRSSPQGTKSPTATTPRRPSRHR